jgi:hypothetical protein
METNILASFRSGGSGSGLALSLGAARVIATVCVVVLLFLLGTAAEHGENGGGGNGRLVFDDGGANLQVKSSVSVEVASSRRWDEQPRWNTRQ